MESRNFKSPWFEDLFFLKIEPVVEDRETGWDLGGFELISYNGVKLLFTFLLKGSTDTPCITPGENTVNKLLLCIIISLETFLFINEVFKEVADWCNLLEIGCDNRLFAVSSDELKSWVDCVFEKHPEMFFANIWHKFIALEERIDPSFDKRLPTQFFGSEINHTTPRHCCRRSYRQILNLEKHSHLWSQFDSLTIC